MSEKKLKYEDKVVKSYDLAKILTKEDDLVPYNSLDFHESGKFAVTASNDGVISIINCTTGTISKSLLSKTYGVENIRFSHHSDCLLYSSTVTPNLNDCKIRYHSIYDNKYLRYFSGHTDRVTSISICPKVDSFISSSLDGTVRTWDIRSPEAKSIIRCPLKNPTNCTYAVYDPEGLVFAIYSNDGYIRMYDARNQVEGPFAKFSLHDPAIIESLKAHLKGSDIINKDILNKSQFDATRLEFSPDGNNLLVSTNVPAIIQLDAFEGKLTQIYTSVQSSNNMNLGACYSSDGSYVAIGCENGEILIYSSTNGELVHTLKDGHIGPVLGLQWNPRRHLLASIHANTCLWMPPTP